MTLVFLGGHVFGSICAPIALAESLVPERRTRPWLGPVALAVMAVLWLLAAALVLQDTLAHETFTASPAQLASTTVIILVLVALAFTRPPAARAPVSSDPVPTPLVVGALSLVLLGIRPLLAALSPLGPQATGWLPAGIALAAVVVWLGLVGGGRDAVTGAARTSWQPPPAACSAWPGRRSSSSRSATCRPRRSTRPTPSCSPSCCCWRSWRRGPSGSPAFRRAPIDDGQDSPRGDGREGPAPQPCMR
jgi:hypothetical protein